jgi:hypothetical protein
MEGDPHDGIPKHCQAGSLKDGPAKEVTKLL